MVFSRIGMAVHFQSVLTVGVGGCCRCSLCAEISRTLSVVLACVPLTSGWSVHPYEVWNATHIRTKPEWAYTEVL